jgi:hypothetical protein
MVDYRLRNMMTVHSMTICHAKQMVILLMSRHKILLGQNTILVGFRRVVVLTSLPRSAWVSEFHIFYCIFFLDCLKTDLTIHWLWNMLLLFLLSHGRSTSDLPPLHILLHSLQRIDIRRTIMLFVMIMWPMLFRGRIIMTRHFIRVTFIVPFLTSLRTFVPVLIGYPTDIFIYTFCGKFMFNG